MSTPFDKLERILKLESEQGFRNSAVIGGLERFLVFWLKEAQAKGVETPEGLTVVQVASSLANYGRRSEQERRERVEWLLERMSGEMRVEPHPAPAAVEGEGTTEGSEVADDPNEPEIEPEPAVETDSEPTANAVAEAPTDAPSPQGEPQEPEAQASDGPREATTPQPTPARTSGLKPSASVVALKGVSTATQEKLARLGIETIDDLIHHFPKRHDDLRHLAPIGELEPGTQATIVGAVQGSSVQSSKGGKPVSRVIVSDGTGRLEASWFGQRYMARQFKEGMEVVLSGRVGEYLGRLTMNSPEWEPLQRELLHTGRLVPSYASTEGISARRMRSLVRNTLDEVTPGIADPLPADLLEAQNLLGLGQALEQAHFPDSPVRLQRAQKRLAFDEMLMLQLGLLEQRRAWREQKSRALFIPRDRIDAFVQGLSFELTGAQKRAMQELLDDLGKTVPMSRLLQGDVGAGKTVVAAAAILAVAHNGLQVAVMAPTAVLAEQHHRTLSRLLGDDPALRCELLIGRLDDEEKVRIREGLSQGQIRVVVGTHALIQESVQFARLGLVIVDEQHRFGVAQRQALLDKGREVASEPATTSEGIDESVTAREAALCPHLLAMSATPIPRSLALAVYGDMDVSVIDEMPDGRQEVVTALRDSSSRERIYSFIGSQIEAGRQAYVICGAIDEEDGTDVRGAVQEHERLCAVFPRETVGLLHGRMDGEAKDAVMKAYAEGEVDILVSTSVIEVGIDVANASVMMVENASRFGLAQLHQFRGRVGRGEHRSYCILMTDGATDLAKRRLEIVESLSDGFALADKDLELRGPGDFFGVEQHGGLPELRMAKLSDTRVLQHARAVAESITASDPLLRAEEHAELARAVGRFWSRTD